MNIKFENLIETSSGYKNRTARPFEFISSCTLEKLDQDGKSVNMYFSVTLKKNKNLLYDIQEDGEYLIVRYEVPEEMKEE